MKNLFFMKRMWVAILTSILFGLGAFATQIPIPSTPADSLEHFLESHTDKYANGDTILLVDASYVVSGTIDLYHGVTIMGDPALSTPPLVEFLDDGFRLKQDSTDVIIRGLRLDGSDLTNGKTASFILRMNNIPASDSIFGYMKIEDVEAWGFGGGIDLHQQKHAQYDSIVVNKVLWHDFSGEYCVDPNINFPGVLKITNSTFYNITHGFVKNPDFASDKNDYTKIPKTYIIDHNTIYNLGGTNNSLIQVNDPKDSTVTFTFTNNIVQKLYDPTNVRPFRIDPSAGTFDFDYNVFYDFMPTNPDKMQYSLDSTAAHQTNVTVTNLITDDPKFLDKDDFRLPLNSPLFTADSKGGQIGDPRWTEFEGVHVYEPEEKVFTNNPVQLEAAIVLASGDTVINWTVEERYGGTRAAATIVDSTGLLTPTVAGQVKVTATSVENGAFFDTLIVTIQDSIHVTAIEVQAETTTIVEKDGDLDIWASITPKNPTDPRIEWSVSNETIAIINRETNDTTIELVAKSNGVVWVKVKSLDSGLEDSLDITVNIPGAPILVDNIEVSLPSGASDTINTIGGTLQLEVEVTPANADNKDVTWAAAPSDVATVVNGLVTSLKEGTVTITATAADGSGISDAIDIVIKVPEPHVSGIQESSVGQIKVFPNPANDFITLNIAQQSIVSIHNIVGERVMNQILEVGGTIDISGLTDGIYFVNAVSGGKAMTVRFVKD